MQGLRRKEDKQHPAPHSPFRHCCSPALTYASETWTLRKHDEHAASVTQQALGRTMLGISLFTQVQKRIRSPELRHRTKIRDAFDYAKKSKIRWVDTLCDIMMTVDERTVGPRVPEPSTIYRSILACDRDEWRRYWRPLKEIDDQRDDM
ncbi:unnamed protein product [Haemonchus placei]|uniref:Uncharacterized protein n=1 Tax=Haemonchus placei TaxID=6290 RepID=A0A0N4WK43_HAEPC|nr:unnamed protein product [Haemonchus placei]